MPMYKLINIDEDSLSDVALSDKELTSINSKLLKEIELLSSNNSYINIDNSLTNVFNTISSSKGDCPDTLHGITNINLLRSLVVQAIEKNLCISKEDVIYSDFFLAGGGMEYTLPGSYIFNPDNSSFYYQAYLTSSELILYCLGMRFKLYKTLRIPLSEIASSSILDTLPDGTELNHKYLYIKFKDNNSKYPSSISLVSKNYKDVTSIDALLDNLKKSGIGEYNSKISKTSIYLYVSLIIAFLIILFDYLL